MYSWYPLVGDLWSFLLSSHRKNVQVLAQYVLTPAPVRPTRRPSVVTYMCQLPKRGAHFEQIEERERTPNKNHKKVRWHKKHNSRCKRASQTSPPATYRTTENVKECIAPAWRTRCNLKQNKTNKMNQLMSRGGTALRCAHHNIRAKATLDLEHDPTKKISSMTHRAHAALEAMEGVAGHVCPPLHTFMPREYFPAVFVVTHK